MKKNISKILIVSLVIILLGIFTFIIIISLRTPSLDRDWTVDQKVLATTEFQENTVSIKNIRNFTYKSTDDYTINYLDNTYDLDDLESVYYIIEPFSKYDGPAHTMLSFGFVDGEFITISVEIRKEVGEEFGPLYGIMNTFELVYVVGTEQDLVKLRANHRKDDVYMYPIAASKQQMKDLFVTMLKRANKLATEPEFYNTIFSNCTTNILDHVNSLRNKEIPWSIYNFLPANSDKIIYKLDMIDTKLTLKEARKYYKINDLSEQYGDSEDYSQMIRKERK